MVLAHRTSATVLAAVLLLPGCQLHRSSADAIGVSKRVGPVTVSVSSAALSLAKRANVDMLSPLYDTVRRVDESLDLPVTTLTVAVQPDQVVPEVGVGGFTSGRTGKVTISLSPTSPLGMATALTQEVDLAAAHELNHATRILSGPGYSSTLRAAMISEGLADSFAASQFPTAPIEPWDRALTPGQAKAAWARAQPVLESLNRDDINDWLFGGHGVARWSAYTLGFRIVQAERRREPATSWAALTRQDALAILKASHFAP